MKTFNKKDISKYVAKKILKEKVFTTEKFINATFIAIKKFLTDTKEDSVRIEIRNFGVFEVKKTKAKPKARNPRSGEIIYVPPHRKVHFKAGKDLKNFLSTPIK